VTLSGSGFASGAAVTIGDVDALDIEVLDGSTITARTGPHTTGVVDVTITNPDGPGATLARSFFYSPPPVGLAFFTVTPCRIIDTRAAAAPLGGPPLAPSAQRIFKVTGACGIPASAVALAVNLTVVTPGQGGSLSAFPGNAFDFGTNVINFSPGQIRASNGVLSLATDGTGLLGFTNGSSGSTHLLVDVTGYFE
jgi:hypothetical protein